MGFRYLGQPNIFGKLLGLSGGALSNPGAAYLERILALDDVLYLLPLNDVAGTASLTDAAGNGFTATPANVTFEAGTSPFKDMQAPLLNGTSSKINLLAGGGFGAAFNTIANAYTISLFIKPSAIGVWDDGVARFPLMFLAGSSANATWLRKATGNTVDATMRANGVGVGGVMTNPADPTDLGAGWSHHLWKSSDADDVAVYKVNGVTQFSNTGIGTWPGSTPLTVGVLGTDNTDSFWWSGYLSFMTVIGHYTTPGEDSLLAGPFDAAVLNSYRASFGGVWTWFNDPRVVRAGNKIFVGSLSSGGNVQAHEFTPALDKLVGPTVLHAAFETDDHDNPALWVRASDNKLLALYTMHLGADVWQRISSNALDSTAWEAEAQLNASLLLTTYTYANLVQLTGEANDPIYTFFRGDNGSTYYSKSADGGATWAAAQALIVNGTERPYFRLVPNGDARIDICYTDGHPNAIATNSVYHAYYTSGAWYQTDGTLISNEAGLPMAPGDGTMIWDGSTAAGQGWVWDIAIDASGYPVVVYAVFPSDTNHRYRYARWNGTTWDDYEICGAGGYLYAAEPEYSGGVALDHEDPNIVYASREIDGTHVLFRYQTSNSGATWSDTQLTTEFAFRPVVVRNHGGQEPRLAYLTGTYTSFTNYDTQVRLRNG